MVQFGKRKSDEWHQKIDLAVSANLHPTSPSFPWTTIRLITDAYIKKKGRKNQADLDVCLSALIQSHEAKDVAIAACAHAMSPASVRALLIVELNVTPVTLFGINSYLESLVAANYWNPQAVSDLECMWARGLIPYASPGTGAAGRYLEGICNLLRYGTVASLNHLPDFAVLTRKALCDFASQLDGLKLKCQWLNAHASIGWLATFLQQQSSSRGLTPQQLLDSQFPTWRIWASWRPDYDRLRLLEGLDSDRRAVLPDLLALEGPDFLGGRYSTLKEGLLAKYADASPLIKFKSLKIEVKTSTTAELADMLDRLTHSLGVTGTGSNDAMALFTHLCVGSTVTQEALQILSGASHIPETPQCPINAAVLQLYTSRSGLTMEDELALSCLLPTLSTKRGESLRGVLLPYLINGVHSCVQQMQDALQAQITAGGSWGKIAKELHAFGQTVKDATYLYDYLQSSVRSMLDLWPHADMLKRLIAIYTEARFSLPPTTSSSILAASLESYCLDRLVRRGMIEIPESRIVDGMLDLWESSLDQHRRAIALLIANSTGMSIDVRCRSLKQLTQSSDEFVKDFHGLLDTYPRAGETTCVNMAKLLANTDSEDMKCWRGPLYRMLEQQSETLLEFSLKYLDTEQWIQWILDLGKVFDDLVFPNPQTAITMLQPSLQLWGQELVRCKSTLMRLETALGADAPAFKSLLRGGECCARILEILCENQDQPIEELLQTVASLISHDGKDAPEISNTMSLLSLTTPEGREACWRTWVSYQTCSMVVVEMNVISYLTDPEMSVNDQLAIEALANALGLEVDVNNAVDEKIRAAADVLERQAEEIFQEVKRLEGLQKALKAKDPQGTVTLLKSLGIADMSPLEEELTALPAALLGSIERVGDQEVELNFPINHLTHLQRAGLGVGTAQCILVRLAVSYGKDTLVGFCTHLDNEGDHPDGAEHKPWAVYDGSTEPERTYCIGRTSLMTWQMSRILHRHFKEGYVSLETTHRIIAARINDMANLCLVCGSNHRSSNASLRRPIPCLSVSCSRLWYRVSINVRFTEIRSDPTAVDLLLTGIYAAAVSSRSDLLPGCPIKSTATVTTILNKLPSMAMLQKVTDLTESLRWCDKSAIELLSWALTSYRGFLASTSGMIRIPGLPQGTQQFMLANASPELEAAFAQKVRTLNPRNAPTKVLFHGTSLDRLTSILIQGLKICSGTALQRTGAAHGTGIYMAEEPVTSLSYSSASTSWKGSAFHNMRVLLGCELAGRGNNVSNGIHVIKDEKTVMVRYVYLLGSNAVAPLASHITPAMVSAFSALRSGAV